MNQDGIERVKHLFKEQENNNTVTVLCPTYKSSIDPFLVYYANFYNGIETPLIFSSRSYLGVDSYIFKKLGGVVINEHVTNTDLKKKLIEEYMIGLL